MNRSQLDEICMVMVNRPYETFRAGERAEARLNLKRHFFVFELIRRYADKRVYCTSKNERLGHGKRAEP